MLKVLRAELAVKLSGWKPESVLNMDESALQDLLQNSAGVRDSNTTFKTKQPLMRFTLAPVYNSTGSIRKC